MRWEEKDSNNQILMGVYRSSWGITTLTLAVVVSLEVFMLVYSVIIRGTPLEIPVILYCAPDSCPVLHFP